MSVKHFAVTAICLGFLLPICASAETPSAESVRQSIEAFKAGPDFQFAPATISRAQAYLGAAMLARDEQKPDDASAALVKALQTIKEAEQTSDNYQQRFASLLSVRKSAKDTQAAMANENDLNSGEVSARQLLEQAEDSLGASIKAMEAGQLNQTQEQATNAEKLYRQALDIMLPALSDKVSRLISRAPYAAKRHAPKTLAAAKNKAAELRAYVDGLSETAPSRPADALYLAQ